MQQRRDEVVSPQHRGSPFPIISFTSELGACCRYMAVAVSSLNSRHHSRSNTYTLLGHALGTCNRKERHCWNHRVTGCSPSPQAPGDNKGCLQGTVPADASHQAPARPTAGRSPRSLSSRQDSRVVEAAAVHPLHALAPSPQPKPAIGIALEAREKLLGRKERSQQSGAAASPTRVAVPAPRGSLPASQAAPALHRYHRPWDGSSSHPTAAPTSSTASEGAHQPGQRCRSCSARAPPCSGSGPAPRTGRRALGSTPHPVPASLPPRPQGRTASLSLQAPLTCPAPTPGAPGVCPTQEPPQPPLCHPAPPRSHNSPSLTISHSLLSTASEAPRKEHCSWLHSQLPSSLER